MCAHLALSIQFMLWLGEQLPQRVQSSMQLRLFHVTMLHPAYLTPQGTST